jgi:hypothetical protein
MTTLSLRLPESIHQGLKRFAQRDGVSLNQFIASAVAEKISAMATEEYIQERAKRASRAKYEAALAQVPHAVPAEYDRIAQE